VTSDCFDLESQIASQYHARFKVLWRGLGRVTKERFQDEACAYKISSRGAAADGSFDWSAPGLGLSRSATSLVATELVELRDRCEAR
jgi:hypothetical protein